MVWDTAAGDERLSQGIPNTNSVTAVEPGHGSVTMAAHCDQDLGQCTGNERACGALLGHWSADGRHGALSNEKRRTVSDLKQEYILAKEDNVMDNTEDMLEMCQLRFQQSGRCADWAAWLNIAQQERGLIVTVKDCSDSRTATFPVYAECVRGCCSCVYYVGGLLVN